MHFIEGEYLTLTGQIVKSDMGCCYSAQNDKICSNAYGDTICRGSVRGQCINAMLFRTKKLVEQDNSIGDLF